MSIWKKIEGYEDLYEVSTQGEVKSFHGGKEKLIKCTIHKQNGYAYFQLVKFGKKKTMRLHKVVMSTFVGDKIGIINHKNGNKADNRLDNLEYVTNRENSCHYWKKTKLPGVTFNKENNRYRARLHHNGKSIHLGYFDSEYLAYKKLWLYEFENKIDNKYR